MRPALGVRMPRAALRARGGAQRARVHPRRGAVVTPETDAAYGIVAVVLVTIATLAWAKAAPVPKAVVARRTPAKARADLLSDTDEPSCYLRQQGSQRLFSLCFKAL